ncbi:MAG: hypothetical protein PF501_14245 [Salinisphaera sp.]|jgi:hypothetical protein|nr:hypothetical protein [Salinisphaera sp.]
MTSDTRCITAVALCSAGLFVASFSPIVQADANGPDDEIYSPNIHAGEFEIEGRVYHQDGNDAGENKDTEYRIELGYSPTNFWETSVEPIIVDGPHNRARTVQLQFENVVSLTPAAQSFINVGAFFDYELATDGGNDELVLGPIVEKRIGQVTLNAQVLAIREISSGGNYGLSYGWQLRYNATPLYAVGVQGFGERAFGSVEEKQPRHTGPNYPTFANGDRAGPAFFGRIPIGDDRNDGGGLDYQFGVLFGLDNSAAEHTFRLVVAYEL